MNIINLATRHLNRTILGADRREYLNRYIYGIVLKVGNYINRKTFASLRAWPATLYLQAI